MKKLAVIMLIVFSMALVAIAADKGPETINLAEKWGLETKKSPVIFDHAKHQQNNTCTDCHATAEGGALVSGGKTFDPKAMVASGELKKGGTKNDVHDELCWKCHKEKKVPKGKSCKTCHE
ncbi:MAG: cytochrome C [Denitrovibrio sp.]|nr:MAG: cytochrome C [Denitrovibrio sp.]